jgi:hypothetical protein
MDSVFSDLPRNHLDAQAANDSFTLSGARVVGSIVTRNTVPCLGFPESETPPEVEAFLFVILFPNLVRRAMCLHPQSLMVATTEHRSCGAIHRLHQIQRSRDKLRRRWPKRRGNNSIYLLAQFIF